MPFDVLPDVCRKVIALFVLALLALFAPSVLLQAGCTATFERDAVSVGFIQEPTHPDPDPLQEPQTEP